MLNDMVSMVERPFAGSRSEKDFRDVQVIAILCTCFCTLTGQQRQNDALSGYVLMQIFASYTEPSIDMCIVSILAFCNIQVKSLLFCSGPTFELVGFADN